MRPQIYPLVAAVFAALAVSVPATADVPNTKQPPTARASARVVVNPGETARWKSPRIGPVERLSLTVAGREAFYQLEPRTNSCVAYGYEAGVAVRITDCRKGKRVPYVRIRATSAALKPVVVTLRLNM